MIITEVDQTWEIIIIGNKPRWINTIYNAKYAYISHGF